MICRSYPTPKRQTKYILNTDDMTVYDRGTENCCHLPPRKSNRSHRKSNRGRHRRRVRRARCSNCSASKTPRQTPPGPINIPAGLLALPQEESADSRKARQSKCSFMAAFRTAPAAVRAHSRQILGQRFLPAQDVAKGQPIDPITHRVQCGHGNRQRLVRERWGTNSPVGKPP
jgi:hypothetical protein